MKSRYRLIRRGTRGGAFYSVDTQTGRRTSLKTTDKDAAQEIIHAKNQAERQPLLNQQLAKAYLAGTDSGVATRTWGDVFEAIIPTKRAANKIRWETARKDRAFDLIRNRVIVQTQADVLLKLLREGTVSTNIYLRRLHNFALDMNWLPWPIIPKRQWPKIRFKKKRGITLDEHQKIIAGESNAELRGYYELLWHIGGSQTDVATLRAEDVDLKNRSISYARLKSGQRSVQKFGDSVARILESRPKEGLLFPMISQWKESDRAKAFSRRKKLVGVSGVTLHSYRYGWAERAKKCGYPERYAQQALGQASEAVHRAYASGAVVELPPLEDYEKSCAERVIKLEFPKSDAEAGSNIGELPQAAGAR